MCSAFALQGLRGTLDSRIYWGLSSRIQKNIVDSVKAYDAAQFSRDNHGRKIYLLNVPDYLKTKKYYSFFYVTRRALIEDIQWRLGTTENRIERISTGDFFVIPFEGENIMYRAGGRKRMTREDVMNLIKQGNPVLWFSPSLLDAVPVTGFSTFDTNGGV